MVEKLTIKSKLLYFFAKKKSIDFEIKNAKKVVFFRYDRIGDMVLTTPVFRELKIAIPEIKIIVLASKVNHGVLLNNPYIDEIITNYKNHLFSDFLSLLKLRLQKIDVCIEFDHSVIPHAILRLKIIKPKKVISIKKTGRYGVDGEQLSLYDIYADKPNFAHSRDIWLGVLVPFGIVPKSNKYDLFVSKELEDQAKKFLENFNSKFLIGININGAVKGKRINFSELLKICHGLYNHHHNIQIIILSEPKNYQKYAKKIKQMNLDYVDISYKTDSILQVASIINKLDLIISPDTSIVHLASAFNKPIVTIHENNQDSYQLFAPTSKLSRTVFSVSKDSLMGFSLDQVLTNCFELIHLINKGKL